MNTSSHLSIRNRYFFTTQGCITFMSDDEIVVRHALYRARRGKRPSMIFRNYKNPRIALKRAIESLYFSGTIIPLPFSRPGYMDLLKQYKIDSVLIFGKDNLIRYFTESLTDFFQLSDDVDGIL